jgi:urea transport system ATP-binding protein
MLNNISLYYGAAQALRGVSISAEPGKVTCVLGRNGVGKTSLLRAMVGQYPIASRLDHASMAPTSPASSPMSARARHRLRAAGPRDFPLLTVEENLKTGFGR